MVERAGQGIEPEEEGTTLFPDEASVLRLVTAVANEINDEWETGRKYLTLEPD